MVVWWMSCAADALARITKYLNGLAYEDEPDYRKLQRLYDDVKELATGRPDSQAEGSAVRGWAS